jgi:hypothetical protein
VGVITVVPGGAGARALVLVRRGLVLAALVLGFLLVGGLLARAHAADGLLGDGPSDAVGGVTAPVAGPVAEVATSVGDAASATDPVEHAVAPRVDRATATEPVADEVTTTSEPVERAATPVPEQAAATEPAGRVLAPVAEHLTVEPVEPVEPVEQAITPAGGQVTATAGHAAAVLAPVVEGATSLVAPITRATAPATDAARSVLGTPVSTSGPGTVSGYVTPLGPPVHDGSTGTAAVRPSRSVHPQVSPPAVLPPTGPAPVPVHAAPAGPFPAVSATGRFPTSVGPPTGAAGPSVPAFPSGAPAVSEPVSSPAAPPAPAGPGAGSGGALPAVLDDPLAAVVLVAVLALAAVGRRLTWWSPEVAVSPG